MPASGLRVVLQVAALVHLVLGLLLLLGSWNDLYAALDLPRLRPALFAQLGGAAILALAYPLLSAAVSPTLTSPASLVAIAVADGLAFLILLAWLVLRWDALDVTWGVDAFGKLLLVIAAFGLATGAVAAGAALRAPAAREGLLEQPAPSPADQS